MKNLSAPKFLLLFFFLTGSIYVFSQDTRNVEPNQSSKSRFSTVKKKRKGLFSKGNNSSEVQYKTSEEELIAFRKRVSEAYAENAKSENKARKQKTKEAKKGEKYHGHKRPPKKRPVGKQKFCNICKIKH